MQYKIYIQYEGKERLMLDTGSNRAAAVYDFSRRVNNTMSVFTRDSSPARSKVRHVDYWLSEVQPDVISGKDFEFIIMQVRISGRVVL